MEIGLLTIIGLIFSAALCLGYTFMSVQSQKTESVRLVAVVHTMGFSTFLWNLSLALYSICNNVTLAKFFFSLVLLGYNLYVFCLCVYAGNYIKMKPALYRVFTVAAGIISLSDWLFFSLKGIRFFFPYHGRMTYFSEPCPALVYHYYTITFFFVLLISMLVICALQKKEKRERRFIRNVVIVNFIMVLFSIPDTVLPLYGVPSFPSSGFGATISFIFLVYFSQHNNTFSISRKNVYDAIYNGTGIAILVLDQNGKLQSGNSAAKKIFGIRKHEHPLIRELFVNCEDRFIQDIFDGNEITDHAISRGSKTPMALDSIVYRDKFGGVYGYIILATDATADELVLEQKLIIESEKEKSRRIKKLSDQVVATLSLTIDAKDKYTNGHSSRVAKYSLMIGRELGLSEEKLQILEYSALLHDIGKIGVPDYIINKSTTLTGEEYSVIKAHPGIGANILSNITELPDLSVGARWHHERYDGTGYPDGKKGPETDLTARIIGVADAYDAMTSNRSYRHYLSQDKVRDELVRNKGIQFDPEIADIMIRIIDQDKNYTLHEDT